MSVKRILFVCTGNTCRSPMAEIILKRKLKLAGIKDVRVSSAGFSACEGDKISVHSAKALKQLGYKPYSFRSRLATGALLINSDIIICMTAEHKSRISNFPNVYTISEISGGEDIPDPYGQDLGAYIRVSHMLEDACNSILDKILEKKEK